MNKKNTQPMEDAKKDARPVRTADQVARHKAIRERFQREQPSLEQLVSSGEYNEPLPMGEHLSIRQAVFALRKAREKAGLSLADVAERTGMDKGALSRIETGQHNNPTVSTLSRYAHALGKRWVWTLEDERTEGEPPQTAAADLPAAAETRDAETCLPPGKKTKSAAALAAQIKAIHDILAQRVKQPPAPARRDSQLPESAVEIREKRYLVHFADAFEAVVSDLPADGENPIVLLLERIQDPGEDNAAELLNLLLNRGDAQRLALKIFEATEMGQGAEGEEEGLTVRKLLGLIAHYALEGSIDPDAPVDVEVWHEDDTCESYPGTMVSGDITEKVLTIYARGDEPEEGTSSHEGNATP